MNHKSILEAFLILMTVTVAFFSSTLGQVMELIAVEQIREAIAGNCNSHSEL